MNKKVIGIILIIILCVGLVVFMLYKNQLSKDKLTETNNNQKDNKINFNGKKVLVAYFSATNNTKSVAEKIANHLGGDLFRIEPEEEYTSEDLDWTDENARVSKEHENESLRNIKLKANTPDDWDSYDIVFIGYPIWWGVAAWPVDTFVKANDFSGKTVIPFCTSVSSELGQSDELLKEKTKTGTWLEGRRFSQNPSDTDIRNWIK